MERRKVSKADRSALRQLGRRIADEIGLEPMATERDPATGRFDPPGFYDVAHRARVRGLFAQWWQRRNLKKP